MVNFIATYLHQDELPNNRLSDTLRSSEEVYAIMCDDVRCFHFSLPLLVSELCSILTIFSHASCLCFNAGRSSTVGSCSSP